ncbi:HAD domain-containing protein [Janthinobacterium lividum]|uniref:HAD domain-containing protein n=1 Tax=Janthinobacterium lividum TaxID=29581 RepID=UPI003AF31961
MSMSLRSAKTASRHLPMILFLDFDGVLHGDPCTDQTLLFCRLPLLEAVLREAPAVEIVITSTWRARRSLQQLKSFFSPDTADKVIGVTPLSQDHQELARLIGPTHVRTIEIEAWLRASGRPWSQWIALDDKRYWFRPFCKNLICCDLRTGLSKEDMDELRRRFFF